MLKHGLDHGYKGLYGSEQVDLEVERDFQGLNQGKGMIDRRLQESHCAPVLQFVTGAFP